MRTRFVVFLILFLISHTSFANTDYSDTVLVAAASKHYNVDAQSKILVSTDKGNTWKIKTLPTLPNHPVFKSIYCSGKGTTAICIAVGDDPKISQLDRAPPVIVVSHDGGATWQSKTIENWIGRTGKLDRVTCTGQGTNMVCAAVGAVHYNMNQTIPFVITSFDQGQTWNYQLIGYPLAHLVSFNSISCTDKGKNALCATVGHYTTERSDFHPMLFISQDGGNTWDMKSDKMGNTYVYYLNSVSCTGEQSNAFCAVGGVTNYYSKNYEFVSVSRDRGKSWTTTSSNPFTGVPPLTPGVKISCIGNGTAARCDYAFQNDLRTSGDQANTWQVAHLPADNLTDISCAGEGVFFATTCVATSSSGYLLTTSDGGKRVNLPDRANSVSCTGDGSSSSVCIVNSNKTISVSNDGGKSWFSPTLPNEFDHTYFIDVVAATGGK